MIALFACGCALLDKKFSRGMEREFFRRCVNSMICGYNQSNKSFQKKYSGFVEETAETQGRTKAKDIIDNTQLYAKIISSAWYEPNNDSSKLTLSQIATLNSTKQGENGQENKKGTTFSTNTNGPFACRRPP